MNQKSPRFLLIALVSSIALLLGAGCVASADDEVDTSSAAEVSVKSTVAAPSPSTSSAVGSLSQCTTGCLEDYDSCLSGAQSDFDACMCNNSRRLCVKHCGGRGGLQETCPAP